jgi:AmmeMemoRadiSam system protein A
MSIDAAGRTALLGVAREAIAHGLARSIAPKVAVDHYPAPLRDIACSFVTLHKDAALRGCIGSLQAQRPLVCDVAQHAFAAAFSDARFNPVEQSELEALHIHVSILSPLEPLPFEREDELIASLRPRVDGLLIDAGGRRATFLPTVWASIPSGGDFLAALKKKAGMEITSGYAAWRYTTQDFEED